ncbi:MAG: hypothetical protein K0S74_932 [Chlamydiales bacterium]|jgi:regulator of sigma E protease|nr:hypothetical protein [Chlamydiales bacterium]
MMQLMQLLYIFLAIFALGFLVFIHELGHYIMARRVGMRVETFSIGFGKPLYKWTFQNVQWQISWFPFGGYVKIAGMDEEEDSSKSRDPQAFFAKKPIDRIKVALSGPLTNIGFALILFSLIWAYGGREKKFSNITHHIGWIDPSSSLYQQGVRPGDAIKSYDMHPFKGMEDHIEAAMLGKKDIKVIVEHRDFLTGQTTERELAIQAIRYPGATDADLLTTGVLSSASYLNYEQVEGVKNPPFSWTPLTDSGIQYGDRILWANGEFVFSAEQLSYLLNESRLLLTVLRDGKVLQVKVPKVALGELKLTSSEREDFNDWQHESRLVGTPLEKLTVLPYQINDNCIVKGRFNFIDPDLKTHVFPEFPFSPLEMNLNKGDKILAVNGSKVTNTLELLAEIQNKKVLIIVKRPQASALPNKTLWTKADEDFIESIPAKDMVSIITNIGTDSVKNQVGEAVLLNPIQPLPYKDFKLTQQEQAENEAHKQQILQRIEEIEDSQLKDRHLQELKKEEEKLRLGCLLQDRFVIYNPKPLTILQDSFSQTWRTLSALVNGSMSPKWLGGPIGIVGVIQSRWKVGIAEATFWIATISVQLGLINLFPIPVFDGGHICLALWEMVTGRRLKGKVLEMVTLSMVVLLLSLALFVTYYDILRQFRGILF